MGRITVVLACVEGGWSVISPLSAAPLMFLSRGDAEAQARRLAKVVAALGSDAEIRIYHRDGDISVRKCAARCALVAGRVQRPAGTP